MLRDVETADYAAAQDWIYAHGLNDGFPVVPPTADLVDAMIAAGGRDRDQIVGRIQGRPNGLSVEQAAVCSVMAGALPAYFPVILATWEAIFEPAFNAMAVLGSSAGTALTTVVSGPYAAKIGMNGAHNLLGPGNRANATLGRAVRLGVMNALGYRSGGLDGAALGSQARYTAHFAEGEPPPGWRPLNVRLGRPAEVTTVTVAVTDAPRQLQHIRTGKAENVIRMLAASMRDPTHCASGQHSCYFFVLGPEHAELLAENGWSEDDVCKALAERSRMGPEELQAAGVPLDEDYLIVGEGRHLSLGSDGRLESTTPDSIYLVPTGGSGAGWSQVIYGYAPSRVTRPVTKEVLVP